MMKNITRKDFIKVTAASGAVFFLDACGFDTDSVKKLEEVKDSLKEAGKNEVQAFESTHPQLFQ